MAMPRLPMCVPPFVRQKKCHQDSTIPRVYRPGIVRGGHVQLAVHEKFRAYDSGGDRATHPKVVHCFTADDCWNRIRTRAGCASCHDSCAPGQGHVLLRSFD